MSVIHTAALIGLGGIAWKYDAAAPEAPYPLTQAGAFLAHPCVHLTAGCSPDEKDREAFACWSGVEVFSSPEEMLASAHPDIVGICSPTEHHADHATLCLKHGIRAIWLEKPPTVKACDVPAIAALAQSHNVPVCVNYFRRYQAQYQQAKQLMNSKFGPCFNVHIVYSPGLARNGCHLLDQAFFLTGAESATLLWVDGHPDPQNPSFAARLSTGEMLIGIGANVAYHSNTVTLICQEGIIALPHGGEYLRIERCTPNPRFPGFFCLAEEVVQNSATSLDNCMLPPLNDLIHAIEEKRPCLSSLESAYLSQKLLEDILCEANA